MKARAATLAGSIAAGFLASACCIVPLVFAILGIAGAAFAVRLAPLRPYLLALTYGLLGGAFYLTYRPTRAECAPGDACGGAARGAKAGLWIATVVVVLATTFPLYSAYLL